MGVIDFNQVPRTPPSVNDNDKRLTDLRAALHSRAPDLVREIFPAAVIKGGEARIGDVSGAPGESMSIQLTGANAGQWFDHATGKGGDLIDLWGMGQGYNRASGFWDGVAELELHLGLTAGARWNGPVARIAAERAKLPKAEEVTKTLEATYVYTPADGVGVLAQVLRYATSGGGKTFRQKNAAGEWKSPEVRPLYRLPAVAATDLVVLVEGEKCADALEAMGVTATTAMGGSNTLQDKTDWSPLAGKSVLLWPDNDDAGRGYMEKVAGLLRGLGCAVALITIPAGARHKWDAADATPDETFAVLREARARLVQLPAVVSVERPDRSLKLVSIREMRAAKPIEWLMHGMIPVNSFAEVIGPPGSMKSFLVLAWALSIAHGRPWMGREVVAGPVVYIAGEGQAGVAPRVVGWIEAKGGDEDAPFFVVPQSVAMPTDQLDELVALILGMPIRPKLIILDTLARTFGPGDENSAADMNAFVAACDKLRVLTGACVLVVHHTGKDIAKGGRGSSALLGAVDTAIAVERKDKAIKVINRQPFGKQKDGAEFDDIALTFVERKFMMGGEEAATVILIADESLIAEPGDEKAAPVAQRLGAVEKAILGYLAKWPDNEHGLTTIHKSLNIEDKTVLRSLRSLVTKGRILETGEERAKRWAVVR